MGDNSSNLGAFICMIFVTEQIEHDCHQDMLAVVAQLSDTRSKASTLMENSLSDPHCPTCGLVLGIGAQQECLGDVRIEITCCPITSTPRERNILHRATLYIDVHVARRCIVCKRWISDHEANQIVPWWDKNAKDNIRVTLKLFIVTSIICDRGPQKQKGR